MPTIDELRFETPLYTVADAGRIVDVPPSTLATWAKGYIRHFPNRADVIGAPIVTFVSAATPGEPTIPFVGLAEALVLAAVRRSGVPMQRVRPALAELQREIGIDHALASRKLLTDGAELLFDYAESHGDSSDGLLVMDLVVVRNNQRVFVEVIESYLRRIEYGPDGYASLIHVPAYKQANVVVDPTRSFGSPIFQHGGARLDDVLHRFWAGESLEDLVEDYRVPAEELEDVLRVASRRAA
jgi:uncharacterized protein (DUF433 family)